MGLATSAAAPGRVGVVREALLFPFKKASAGVAVPGQTVKRMAAHRINPINGRNNQRRLLEAAGVTGVCGARFDVRTGWVDAAGSSSADGAG